ncbi:MAG: H(+)/Cl(-) exchange transporter ClcA [Alcaligenaceae bacterium]|jgi:CIC family chloride channel protein|nr:H(+)/Cl(-) exchange transporter ClcA [Alcaligenaceae bacterium]
MNNRPTSIAESNDNDDNGHNKAWLYYFIAAVVGLLTGVLGSFFHQLIDHSLAWSRHLPEFLGLEGIGLYLFLSLFSAAMFCLAVALVRFVAPEASGSGVQEIEGAMAGLRNIRWQRVLPVKFIGGTLALGAGLIGGREGPTIHMGASIAKALGSWFSFSQQETRALWGAGGAAGLTAAFNAPIASVLFILEEARKVFPYSGRTYSAAIIACGLSAIATVAISGSRPFMALDSTAMPLSFLPVFIVLGVILGAMGVLFNRMVLAGLDLSLQIGLRFSPYLIPALLGIVIGPMLVVFPEATGGGESLAVSIVNNPMPIGLLGLVILIRFFGTAASYSSGAPAGIFAPILALATASSVFLAELLSLVMPLPPGGIVAFAAAGMAGLFASTVRAPLVGMVLVAELTGSYVLVIPVLLTAIMANIVADALGGRPIYEVLLERTLRLEKKA